MTNQTSLRLEKALQKAFKFFNRFMLLMWRLGLGNWINIWPDGIGRIMVITHTGRKSGRRYRTPVNYVVIDGDIYCTAGFGQMSDWYRNLRAQPEVEVWLPNGWWQATAEDVTSAEGANDKLRQVLIASGFAAYAAGIHPRKMSDEDLAAATASYRLVRIRRVAARTGAEGPGDLSWVWPLATFMLLPLALLRRRR